MRVGRRERKGEGEEGRGKGRGRERRGEGRGRERREKGRGRERMREGVILQARPLLRLGSCKKDYQCTVVSSRCHQTHGAMLLHHYSSLIPRPHMSWE